MCQKEQEPVQVAVPEDVAENLVICLQHKRLHV